MIKTSEIVTYMGDLEGYHIVFLRVDSTHNCTCIKLRISCVFLSMLSLLAKIIQKTAN